MSVTVRPIVVGWDTSPGAQQAVRWAADWARRWGRPLRLIFAVESPAAELGGVAFAYAQTFTPEEVDAIFEPALQIIETVAAGHPVSTEAIEGHPASVLIQATKSADLVVLGTRGHSRLVSTLIGSVSDAVASHGFCPVVVARGDSDSIDSQAPVVVGADGSRISHQAVLFAAKFADAAGTRLVAVCAAPDPVQLIAPEVIVDVGHAQEVHDHAQRYLGEAIGGLRQDYPDLVIDTRIVDVPAGLALTEVADDVAAQLVVVGSHGRGGFTGMLLGSVSRTVLHHARCPVAVLRSH
jgi:nucleotide-binding universal stress UspA family protein